MTTPYTTEKARQTASLEETAEAIVASCDAMPELFCEGVFVCDEAYRVLALSRSLQDALASFEKTHPYPSVLTFFADDRLVFQKDRPQYSTLLNLRGECVPVVVYQRLLHPSGSTLMLLVLQKKTQTRFPLKRYFLAQFPNRFLFLHAMLQEAMRYNALHQSLSALCLLDIDHFKTINHVHGYAIGDEVLSLITKRLASLVKFSELEHLNGDEFAIVLHSQFGTFDDTVAQMRRHAASFLKVLAEPLDVQGHTFLLTSSIGIVVFDQDEYTVDHIIQYADNALYEAKKAGRNTIAFFNPSIQRKLEEKVDLLAQLRDAIALDHMRLVYQKQWTSDAKDAPASVIGAEALVRWYKEGEGEVAPDRFIALSEESGLIVPLGKWILSEAFHELKRWEKDPVKRRWQLSINISVKQFEQEDFISTVQALLSHVQCNPTKVRFELTESLLIQDLKSSLRKIHTLSKLGISFSIDDFGTGYSSLAYLKRLPIHELKIDKTFIRDLTFDSADIILVRTILGIARQFHLDVVAEGVETYEQYALLCDMGCRFFQGYFLSRPVPSAAL